MAQGDDWMHADPSGFPAPTDLRTEVPHPARVYDFLLGGKDHFAADREAGEAVMALGEGARQAVRANRAFLQRAVRTLAGLGIDQFLDIGTGIPTAGNTHQIAQAANPDAKVVYVDNDPIVLTHARALMSQVGQRSTRVLQADLRDPDKILAAPEVTETIDFSRPVGLLLVAVLHFLKDAENPGEIVSHLVQALPPGSHVVLSHVTGEALTDDEIAGVGRAYSKVPEGMNLRTREQVAAFLEGLELLEPGLVLCPQWRPDEEVNPDDRVSILAAVAAKR
ncbi:SAM-dependent methyltransferase [Streptacidiphilus cavernicola]|uniref:SAM-dependent methyltransferase n=1 Tax=Streptacidiphilus cavernicola TaxID=3342716 RepID=A0ABV6VYA5_9ACTN